MKILLKVLNYAGYLIGCSVLGDWFGKVYYKIPWFGFVSDADYAEEHPYMYLIKLAGVIAAGTLLALAIIWYPLTKLMNWINSKIDKHFDKTEEDEWDE